MKVRIVEPALNTYTGMLYNINFTNGISDRELTQQEVSIIGAAMRVQSLDDNSQVGAGVEQLNAKNMTLQNANQANATQVEKVSAETGETSVLHTVETESQDQPASNVEPVATVAAKRWTHDELAAIADAPGVEGGISGLRAIAAPMGIKGRSINELIQEILAAQGA